MEEWLSMPWDWTNIPDLATGKLQDMSDDMRAEVEEYSMHVPFQSNDIVIHVRLGDISTHCPHCTDLYKEYVLTVLAKLSFDKVWLRTVVNRDQRPSSSSFSMCWRMPMGRIACSASQCQWRPTSAPLPWPSMYMYPPCSDSERTTVRARHMRRGRVGLLTAASDVRAFCLSLAGRRIILTPSTFGWWAAWLSSATEVHWPGILKWHPLLNMTTSFVASRPHQLVKTGKAKALWVNETRYIYHGVPLNCRCNATS
eukprot:scaffold2325_cov374-Prasinococcus_capsulatus_cf.AAC.8